MKTLFFTFHFVSKDAKTVNTRIDSFWGSPMLSSFAKQSERGSIFGSHQSWCYPYFSINEKLCIMRYSRIKNLKKSDFPWSRDFEHLSLKLPVTNFGVITLHTKMIVSGTEKKRWFSDDLYLFTKYQLNLTNSISCCNFAKKLK